jgi:DNA-binding transcriptional LysR family regulator
MSLVARGFGIGIVTPAAFAGGAWRDEVQVIASPDFRPCVRAWLLHRAPAGRLARPIAAFRKALIEALREPDSLREP